MKVLTPQQCGTNGSAARHHDVDLDGGILRVRRTVQRLRGQGLVFGPPKSTRSRRTIPLPNSSCAALLSHLSGRKWSDWRQGTCALAVRYDALTVNPVREIRLTSPKPKDAPRALTIAEARQLLACVTYDHYAVEHDVPDLLAFLVATGCRIGEALGITWDRVDLDHGTVVIDRQAIRIKGQSLRMMPTKTDAGTRALALPSWSLDMLKDGRF